MAAVRKYRYLLSRIGLLAIGLILLKVLFSGRQYIPTLRAADTDQELAELLLSEAKLKEKVTDHQTTSNSFFGKVEPEEALFVIVVCETTASDIERSGNIKSKASKTFVRQLMQVEVIFKTAILFTTRKLHFMLVTNTVEVFLKLLDIMKDWPTHMTEKLRITRRQTWHPPGTDDMMKDFRTCTAQMLFLHQALPDVDAAAYIDTDTLFLRSPTELWSSFKYLDDKHIAAITECFYMYATSSFHNKFGYALKTGINAGLALMNYTRMRALPFDLSKALIDVYRKHRYVMRLIDQDVYNHFFSLHPELLSELSCDWNMRHGVCNQNPFPCEPAKFGISMIHGTDVVFFRDYDWSSRAVFETFLNFNMTTGDPKQIPQLLKTALDGVLEEGKSTRCGRVKGFTEMVLRYPTMHFNSSQASHAPT